VDGRERLLRAGIGIGIEVGLGAGLGFFGRGGER